MIGGKMVGTELAPMIADIKRVSQLFQGFKSTDMLEISQILWGRIACAGYGNPSFDWYEGSNGSYITNHEILILAFP